MPNALWVLARSAVRVEPTVNLAISLYALTGTVGQHIDPGYKERNGFDLTRIRDFDIRDQIQGGIFEVVVLEKAIALLHGEQPV